PVEKEFLVGDDKWRHRTEEDKQTQLLGHAIELVDNRCGPKQYRKCHFDEMPNVPEEHGHGSENQRNTDRERDVEREHCGEQKHRCHERNVVPRKHQWEEDRDCQEVLSEIEEHCTD